MLLICWYVPLTPRAVAAAGACFRARPQAAADVRKLLAAQDGARGGGGARGTMDPRRRGDSSSDDEGATMMRGGARRRTDGRAHRSHGGAGAHG